MKINKRILFSALAAVFLYSCASKTQVAAIKGSYIPVTTKTNTDPALESFIDGYKAKLAQEMDVVIVESAMDMYTGSPESPLTNLTCDAMMLLDINSAFPETKVAFVNVHGIRADLAKGQVSAGDVFNLYPFDNEVCVVTMKGENLIELFGNVAQSGTAGVSSNVKMTIKDKTVNSLLLDGETIDPQKEYTIITIDYLAEGNDGLTALKKADKVFFTKVKLRDFMLDYFKNQNKLGKSINSPKDGRISIIQ